jgi:predicted SAM-dependent methyltransferase
VKELLHVGCGCATIENIPFIENKTEWREYRLDINPDAKPDYLCSMMDMSCVPEERFDMLYASHCLEHIKSHEVVPTLYEFSKKLKPGGALLVIVPDIDQVAKFIVEKGFLETMYLAGGEVPIRPIDVLYGWVETVKEGNDWMMHKTGFTRESLELACLAAGFSSAVANVNNSFDIAVVAVKSKTERDEDA